MNWQRLYPRRTSPDSVWPLRRADGSAFTGRRKLAAVTMADWRDRQRKVSWLRRLLRLAK